MKKLILAALLTTAFLGAIQKSEAADSFVQTPARTVAYTEKSWSTYKSIRKGLGISADGTVFVTEYESGGVPLRRNLDIVLSEDLLETILTWADQPSNDELVVADPNAPSCSGGPYIQYAVTQTNGLTIKIGARSQCLDYIQPNEPESNSQLRDLLQDLMDKFGP